jgi:hypothetical protein
MKSSEGLWLLDWRAAMARIHATKTNRIDRRRVSPFASRDPAIAMRGNEPHREFPSPILLQVKGAQVRFCEAMLSRHYCCCLAS